VYLQAETLPCDDVAISTQLNLPTPGLQDGADFCESIPAVDYPISIPLVLALYCAKEFSI
jgi:hypothetical protein